MIGAKHRNSRIDLFKELDILSLPRQYIFSLVTIMVNKENLKQIQLYHM